MRLSVACALGHNIFSECSLTCSIPLTGWLAFVVSFVLPENINLGGDVLSIRAGLEVGCLGYVTILVSNFFLYCSLLVQKVEVG